MGSCHGDQFGINHSLMLCKMVSLVLDGISVTVCKSVWRGEGVVGRHAGSVRVRARACVCRCMR